MAKSKTPEKLRKVELKVLPKTDNNIEINYREMFEQVLINPRNPKEGTSIAEMRKVQPILDKLDELSDGDTLYLTKDEWQELRDRVNNFPFRFNSAHLIELADDLKNPPLEKFAPTGEEEEAEEEEEESTEEGED